MDLAEIEALARKGESEDVELKRSTANLPRAVETLCGMLNGRGGVVLVGVADDGRVVGQHVSDSTLREVASALGTFEPTAPVRVERVPVGDGREVIVLSATPEPGRGPWMVRGRAWRRVGPTTTPMSQQEYERHLLNQGHGVTLWETLPTNDLGIDDLDHQAILRTVRLGIETGRLPEDTGTSIPDILDRLHLRHEGRLVNAAVVLFSKSPFPFYPQCGIRLARFEGTTKDEFVDNRQEYGHAFALLDEAINFLRRHLSIAGRFHSDSIVREDIPEYPILALREAVVNALIHRSYVDIGGAVSVAVFDDRLEVWSHGVLPFGQRPEQLKKPHTSQPRNPIIANVFYRCGLIEQWGRGTQKIVEQCVRAGHPEPEFAEQAGAVVVTFRRGVRQARTPVHVLTSRQQEILSYLREHTPQPINAIHSALHDPPTVRMVRNDLVVLRDLGRVRLEGSGRGAVWAFVQGEPE